MWNRVIWSEKTNAAIRAPPPRAHMRLLTLTSNMTRRATGHVDCAGDSESSPAASAMQIYGSKPYFDDLTQRTPRATVQWPARSRRGRATSVIGAHSPSGRNLPTRRAICIGRLRRRETNKYARSRAPGHARGGERAGREGQRGRLRKIGATGRGGGLRKCLATGAWIAKS